MITVGVTGAMGSGKSTVVGLLRQRGAVAIDADAIARRAIDRGSAPFQAVVDRFGPGVLDGEGDIDRTQLAAIVFAEPDARRDLEQIVHPIVEAEIRARLTDLASTDSVVVLDLPLLVETGGRARYGLDGVLVVDAPTDLALDRVVQSRRITVEDARARIAAQADSGSRARAADFIIMNHGTLDELSAMVDGAWTWIGRLRVEREGG
jgi:dephospho-CoA kinase